MPPPFPSPANEPSFLRETSSGDPNSIWQGKVVDVWRSGVNQWQAFIKNNRGEERQLVITRVKHLQDNVPDNVDFAEFGGVSPTSSVQQYWMGLKSNWQDDHEDEPTTGSFLVQAQGLEISGQRRWEANFVLPKAYTGPIDPKRNCPHPPPP